tara:strand:- start:2580 stop:3137 length:558 start_codon:yes stop_codon:yes gene_type:complete
LDKELKNAVIALKSDETILYPTDTVWGIGCDALSDNAIKKIFKLKKRDYSNGLICLASSFEMISKYADINEIEKLNQVSEDSPTTFIFDNPKNISNFILGNNCSVAFRVPKNNFCIRLIEAFGKPVVSTSANISGFKVPVNFNDIDPEIKKNVGYVVKLNQAIDSNTPSKILKYNNDSDCFDILR